MPSLLRRRSDCTIEFVILYKYAYKTDAKKYNFVT